jgi:splicing factor 3A subunit 1
MAADLSQVDVANNLKRLASQRTDLFDGVTGEALSEEERERRKRAATAAGTASAPVFEGNTGPHPSQLQRMTVEEQIKAIHDKFGSGGGGGKAS